jgi:putative membrane protein
MKKSAIKFLTESEKEEIQKAVKEAEKHTSGEIVPMIVPCSYSYPLSNMIGGLVLGLIIALSAVLILKNENLWLFLAVFIVSLIVMHRIIEFIPPLKRLFISDKEKEEEVQEAALVNFYKNGLYKTRDATGVLLFISVFERKVWLLADKGINSKLEAITWQDIVDDLIKGIKTKKQGDAIVHAVTRIGEILRTHFPVKKDDTDELDNLIIK